jgi:Uma2 family endonuclease
MSTSTRLHTVEDLYGLPDDGAKNELQAGVLLSEPLPGFLHGRVVARVGQLLGNHVVQQRLGEILAGDSGFVLARGPDTVRGPDVAFVSKERVAALAEPARAFEGAPDLAVEVLSPSNTPREIHGKVADYLAAGTRLVWVVDPERETLTVYRTLLAPEVLAGDDEVDGGDVVPGFRAKVAALLGT